MSNQEPVRSPRNPRVVDAARLRRARNRSKTGRTLVEGPHLISAAEDAGIAFETIFTLEPLDNPASLLVTQDVLEKISETQAPRGPIGVMMIPKSQPVNAPQVVVLDNVADPGNMGTIIRSAAAFGADVVCVGGVDPWNPKVLRSAAGAHFLTTIERHQDYTAQGLKERGYQCWASVVGREAISLEDTAIVGPSAIWIGNEAHGLDDDVLAGMDGLVTIPMPGSTESLNAAVAASIFLYVISRR